ncbi:helix-turn-helix domain-containing protein [Phenylobacterium sp. J367]|uniref:winged helix-turn-helix transcriptional regulator n=1 Tax=Phenylobacterium sp. J367 TaxID=2898435 RepID=UPI002150DC16|nr:helix-turn-helix domain-containing protein [Phenylobacterium sp. J367]MCR5878295.1 helix-turn-helix transcriptional regulator [Phenylobacterium sp. J367]
MAERGYSQFCPVAMAAEVLTTRWTPVVLRELLAGTTRFNELRRGMPRMSPALLSQRLKDLEAAGLVVRTPIASEPGVYEYRLTPAGQGTSTVVEALGFWGQRWVDKELSLQNVDATLLMWDMRRQLDPSPMPPRRSVIQFLYSDQPPATRSHWLVVEPGCPVDLCSVDPGFEVDLYATCDLRTMTAIWMGAENVRGAVRAERLRLVGDPQLADSMQTWLGLSPFAREQRLAS